MARGRGRGHGGCGGRGGRGENEPAPEAPQDMAAILAEMQAMRAELNALCQVPPNGGGGTGDPPPSTTGGSDPPAGGNVQRPLELRQWCGMHLELFAGNGAPVEAADWLSAVVDKLEAFQIPSPDWVRYAGQLLKGEALVWWRSVISSRNATSGPVTW